MVYFYIEWTDNIHLIKFYWFRLCFTRNISICFFVFSLSLSLSFACVLVWLNVSAWFGLVWLDFDLYYVFGLIFGVLFSALCLRLLFCIFVCMYVCIVYALFTFSRSHSLPRSLSLCFSSIYCCWVLFHAIFYTVLKFRWGRAEKLVNLVVLRLLCIFIYWVFSLCYWTVQQFVTIYIFFRFQAQKQIIDKQRPLYFLQCNLTQRERKAHTTHQIFNQCFVNKRFSCLFIYFPFVSIDLWFRFLFSFYAMFLFHTNQSIDCDSVLFNSCMSLS